MLSEKQLESRITPAICATIKPDRESPGIIEDIRQGLLSPPRSLPPKYFYDEYGSQLFEEICTTSEYYPTRTEEKLLSSHSKEIISHAEPDEIMELGSGNSQKTRTLFDACEHNDHVCSYAPLDICKEILENTSEQLQSDYNWLDVKPLLGDYNAGLRHLPEVQGPRLYVFLGSTIGNFHPQQAKDFISEVKATMRAGDYFLLGADRIKDEIILNAAYNDKQGITAKFNLNVLNVLNRELEGDFNANNFEHKAEFNSELKRIEMYLVCKRAHVIDLRKMDEQITFKRGDKILTEVSHKFTFSMIKELLEDSGLNIHQHYEPNNKYFSLVLAGCEN